MLNYTIIGAVIAVILAGVIAHFAYPDTVKHRECVLDMCVTVEVERDRLCETYPNSPYC